MTELPASARVVIVGGGIVGCSTAYHLTRLGWTDVLLLERSKLTSGTTWHAAGLVGQLRSSAGITQLLGRSVDLYRRLEAETGQATGWKMNGGLRLACTPDRWTEVKRQATTARSFGLEMHLLTPAEARELWPLMTIDDLVGAAFLPTDGQASPSDVTQALAKGARQGGARLVENCQVSAVELRGGRVRAVLTARGRVECEVLVNCCGRWAREFGRMAGVNVPVVPLCHQYLITEPMDGVSSGLPTLRDPDRLTYYKEEVGGLVMGGYEPDPIPWEDGGKPHRPFRLLEPDWAHFQQLMDQAVARVPALESAGVQKMIHGVESFTPDGNFVLGEAPEVDGYFVGAGFNSFGIAAGGGAGQAMAEWIVAGEPPYDLWPVDIRRFGRGHRDERWIKARTLELYGKHYGIAWPQEEHASGRPLRRSPLYDRLKAAGACFGEKLGWERPNWFAPPGMEPRDVPSLGRPNWFEAVAEEHRAARERVAVFDQSSFAKFLLQGPQAEAALSWICANDVARPPGSLAYTQMLNSRGGIECDLTVARLAEDRYYIVTGTGFATHDFHWIRRHLPADAASGLTDLTSAYATLSVMGPRSRELLAPLSDGPLDNVSFPFGSVREIDIAGAPAIALRITYVGELGWELHIPVEFAATVYDALMAAGRELGIANAGYRAIDSLRLEKGYRAWGADIGPTTTPLEAGLGFAVKLSGPTPFLGREALERQAAAGPTRRLCGFSVDDPGVVLLGRETVYRDGEAAGWLTSGGFGHTLGRPLGYGYVHGPAPVTADWLQAGRYELEVAAERVPCRLHLRPPYDPAMERIKA